jgi:hypothetical protein
MKYLLALIFITAGAAHAFDALIPYSGQLADDGETIVADTTVTMTFTLYTNAEAPDSTLWTETHPAIVVHNGLFNVSLGSLSPLSAAALDFPQVWLGVTVGGDSELAPRSRVLPVPYAITSERVIFITPRNVEDAIQAWAALDDADQDGFIKSELGGDDCDDWNPYTYPGATKAVTTRTTIATDWWTKASQPTGSWMRMMTAGAM